MARKINRFYNDHKKLLIGLLVIALLTTSILLTYGGVLFPLLAVAIKPLLLKVGISLSNNIIAYGLSVIGSLISPLVLKLAQKITTAAIKLAHGIFMVAVHIAAIALTSIGSGIKIGFKALVTSDTPREPDNAAQTSKQPSVVGGSSLQAMIAVNIVPARVDYKADDNSARPLTGSTPPLFHPRQQRPHQHNTTIPCRDARCNSKQHLVDSLFAL